MYKRKNDFENDKKFKRLVMRNWIICGVSLALAIICYFGFGSSAA